MPISHGHRHCRTERDTVTNWGTTTGPRITQPASQLIDADRPAGDRATGQISWLNTRQLGVVHNSTTSCAPDRRRLS